MVEGYPDGTFLPNKDVTRAEFAVMLYQALLDAPIDSPNPFEDLTAPESWYYDEVVSLAALGIVNGRPVTLNGQSTYVFDPDATITREEMVTMVYRVQKLLEEELVFDYVPDDLTGYTDAGKLSDWAADAMQWAVGSGIVNGMTNTTLVPKGNTTRAQVCKVLVLWLMTIPAE